MLLALEVAIFRRPTADRHRATLIRRISIDNPLWGAPRIHGELLKLGFEVAQSSVAKYMVKRRQPPSQGWRTFLRNHASEIAAMDFFVVRSTSQRIQRRNGLPVRSRRHFLGMGLRAI